MKVTQDWRAAKVPEWKLRKVYCNIQNNALLFGRSGEIGWGKNSGFQALNLAIQFGARRIALCGFDFHARRGTHHHGRHAPPLNNPNEAAFDAWLRHLEAQAGVLKERGVDVFVATPDSRLQSYPRRPLMELLDELATPQAGAHLSALVG